MRDIIHAIKYSIIRFFENRFVTDDRFITHLELELAKARIENQKLLDIILVKPVVKEEEEKPLPLPITTGGMIPWHIRRQQLEGDDRKLAAMKREQIQELENQLGVK